MKKLAVLTLYVTCSLFLGVSVAVSQEEGTIVSLSKQALEAQSAPELYAALDSAKEGFLIEQRHSDCVDFLRSLSDKKGMFQSVIDYFIAVTRYEQLIYLEDNQLWDEYFSRGNIYRDELTGYAQSARDEVPLDDPVAVLARIVLWRFHSHQQDAFLEEARDDLMQAVTVYASGEQAETSPIKAAADAFLGMGERVRAKQLYRLYIERVAQEGLSAEELKTRAQAALSDGNVDLAQSMYDLYIVDALETQEKTAAAEILSEIAQLFTYTPSAPYDMAYAEEVFQKAEDLIGKEAFSEAVLYKRALNLQAAQEYLLAKECFEALLNRFPESSAVQEIRYKTGMLTAYALRDREGAYAHFRSVLDRKEEAGVFGILSRYQLGLLHQWNGQDEEARLLYEGLLTASAGAFSEMEVLIQQRLSELEEGGQIEYNLKTYLDLTFLDEHSRFTMTRVILSSDPRVLKIDESATVTAQPVLGPTGCFQVDVQYMWSGQLGSSAPLTNESSFVTAFADAGTKAVFIVVNSPTGYVDRNFILVDVE